MQSPDQDGPNRSAPVIAGALPELSWLMGLLALPWFLHASVVLCSSLGAQPLAGPVPAWLLIVVSLACAWFLARRARPAPPEPPEPRARSAGRDARSAEPPSAAGEQPPYVTPVLHAVPIAGAIAFVWPLLSAAFLPIIAYDAISYRLPVVAQWLDAGRIAWVSSDDPVRNGYPLGCEAVSALIAAASGSLRFAGMTSFFFVAAAVVAILWLLRACDVRPLVARAAAASFALVPMLILNAPSGYVDAAFASACVCLFCTATLCSAAASWWIWLAAGLSAAHVLSLKGTGLPFVVLSVGLCGVRALLQRQMPPLKNLAAFVVAALPGLFWPLRNLVNTGNPLWPIRVSLGGRDLFPGVGTAEQILDVASNTPKLLASHAAPTRVLLTWLQWFGPALDFDYRLSGLGYAWLFIAVPAQIALLLRFWREPATRTRYAPITFVLLLTAACFALQPMVWWSRYTLWLWGGGALGIGCVIELLLRLRLPRGSSFLIVAWAMLSVSEAAWALGHVGGLHLAVRRYPQLAASSPNPPSFLQSVDLKHALQNKKPWIAAEFWELVLRDDTHPHARICRGEWKPKTDNANLDGVLAQLVPRPRVFIIPDDHVAWAVTKRSWQEVGCPSLLLFRGSPVLSAAQVDADVNILKVRAFDPLYLLQAREPLQN